MMDLNQLTVVIPTKNERNNIAPFLRSLPQCVSLIVIDASTDDTPQAIRQLRPQYTRVIHHLGNIAMARQIGAEQAQTPWVLFADADVVFADDYFERLAALPDLGAEVGAVYGSKHSVNGFRFYHHWFSLTQGVFARFNIPAATGSNMLVSRKALHCVGGFDLALPCNEDSELIWRIQRGGFDVRFDSALKVFSTDHRRLRQSVLKNILHSSARCLLLYLNLLPQPLRQHDWGYWKKEQTQHLAER